MRYQLVQNFVSVYDEDHVCYGDDIQHSPHTPCAKFGEWWISLSRVDAACKEIEDAWTYRDACHSTFWTESCRLALGQECTRSSCRELKHAAVNGWNELTAPLQEQKLSFQISWRIRTGCHSLADQVFPFMAVNFFLFCKLQWCYYNDMHSTRSDFCSNCMLHQATPCSRVILETVLVIHLRVF